MNRASLLLVSSLFALSLAAAEVGPEIEVTAVTTSPFPAQRNVFIENFDLGTLVAFEELTPAGVSRVVLHQYRATVGRELGRETFSAGTPFVAQYQPRIELGLLAYLEEDPAATYPWLTWQSVWPASAGDDFAPKSAPERVAEVKPRTTYAVVSESVLYLLMWTAPDGRLKGARRQIMTLVGFDHTPFYLTSEPALNPAAEGSVIAYNRPEASGKNSLRVTSAWGREAMPAIDLAGEGALDPRVVFNGTDHFVFWSMENGGVYAQRIRTNADHVATKSGETLRISDGILNDATFGPNGETFVVVDEGWRYSLLRLDANLNVVETTLFRAQVAAGEEVRIRGSVNTPPILAYAAETYAAPRAVLRIVESRTPQSRRRSAR